MKNNQVYKDLLEQWQTQEFWKGGFYCFVDQYERETWGGGCPPENV